MSKSKLIIINPEEWTTPTMRASYTIGKSGKPVSVEYICKLMRQGRLRTKRIEELNITLVER